MLYPIFIFILAGLCEIGGGYLIWLWLREGQSSLVGLIGGAILMLYGVITMAPISIIRKSICSIWWRIYHHEFDFCDGRR